MLIPFLHIYSQEADAGVTQFLLDVQNLLLVVLEEADIIRSLWQTDHWFADSRQAPL